MTNNIDEQVDHLEKKCHLFAKSYTYLSKTEFGATMHNILLSVRRLESAIRQITEYQHSTILNVVPFKTNSVLISFGHIKTDISLAQPFDVDNRDEEDCTDWDAMIKLENKETPFTLGDDYEEYNKTRYFLMSSIRRNYFETTDRIKQISQLLRELEEHERRIEKDLDLQINLYNMMLEDYRNNEWAQDYNSYILQVNEEISDGQENGDDMIAIMKEELGKLKSEHLHSYMPAPVKRLYNTVVSLKRPPYEAMVRYRKKLTEDDISDYFSFLHKYNTLKNHIDSIPLLAPVTGRYEKLFTSRAAKEYMDILKPVIWTYGGIEKKGHFAILLLVMNDLGISQIKNTPYLQMMYYANEININDESLRFTDNKDQQSMISKVGGMIGNTPFCELEFGEIGDSKFDEDKIREYQKLYSRCFRIINQRGLRIPKEIKIASYIKEADPNVNMSAIMGDYPREKLIRLDFLRSVMRRETLIFG